MKLGIFVALGFILFAVFVVWFAFFDGREERKIARITPAKGTKLYGDDNGLFLSYPSVDWEKQSSEYGEDVARFLFALSWNSTSSKVTSQKVPIPSGFDTLVELKSKPWTSELQETYGLFLHSSIWNVTIISFGGTESYVDIYDDLSYSQMSPIALSVPSGVLTHSGFYGAYMDIRSQLRELVSLHGGRIFMCGYSMGSGLLGVCALDFAKDPSLKMCLSFASPRVVNPVGREYLRDVAYYRIANSEDIVPYLPPPIISDIVDYGGTLFYEHIGENIVYTNNLLSVLNNHTTAYRKYMGF
nr:class 3 lipase [Marseillevirus cajuinensis]